MFYSSDLFEVLSLGSLSGQFVFSPEKTCPAVFESMSVFLQSIENVHTKTEDLINYGTRFDRKVGPEITAYTETVNVKSQGHCFFLCKKS